MVEDPLVSVGLVSTFHIPKTPPVPEKEDSSVYTTTQSTAVINLPDESSQTQETELESQRIRDKPWISILSL